MPPRFHTQFFNFVPFFSLALSTSVTDSDNQLREKGTKKKLEGILSVAAGLELNSMAFISFLGRVLFASFFILSAYQEFNEFELEGGPAVKALAPKINAFASHVKNGIGIEIPSIEMKYLMAASVSLKGVASIFFIFGSSIGAYLLALHQLIATPILFDFYNYEHDENEFITLFINFTQHMALLGALLFFIGMKNSYPKRQLKKTAPKTKIT